MIEFIKRLFGIKSNKKRPQYTTKYVTETNSDDNDFIDITPFNKTGEILIHSPTKIESNDDYEEIIRYTVTKKDLRCDVLELAEKEETIQNIRSFIFHGNVKNE